MVPDVPSSFDWVSARAECNVRELFSRLRDVVESDCNIANEKNRIEKAVFESRSEEKFTVSFTHSETKALLAGACFHLKKSEIQVADLLTHKPLFTAKAYLLDGGDCTFVVDDKPLKAWQVSRLALEDVFF